MAVSQSARMALTRWSAGTDPFTRAQMDDDHAQLEAKAAGFLRDTFANRPVAAAANAGYVFEATDLGGRLYWSSGAEWVAIGAVSDFGTGADGNVTIASATTLTRDMAYANLTVNAGQTLTTNGYRILVSGTLTLNGTIVGGNGGNGASNSGGAGGGGGTSGGPPGDGSNWLGGPGGGNGVGIGKSVAGLSSGGGGGSYNGGSGGGQGIARGGNGGSGAGAAGVAGASNPQPVAIGHPDYWHNALPVALGGGTGGGGGGSSSAASNWAGGGGGGGGAIAIFARRITGAGTLQSRGGNGGNAVATGSGAGGGGGGGGGGSCFLFLAEPLAAGITVDLAGGAGGAAGGADATAGAAGTAGTLYVIIAG